MKLLKILICCGGGFSSSYVTTRMQKQIKENHLENQVQIDFSPFSLMHEVIDQYDVVMCCPHLLMDIKLHFKDTGVPLYVLPPRMYGLMKLTEIVDDAKMSNRHLQTNKTESSLFSWRRKYLKSDTY